jgi:hypothetical protein
MKASMNGFLTFTLILTSLATLARALPNPSADEPPPRCRGSTPPLSLET